VVKTSSHCVRTFVGHECLSHQLPEDVFVS
jgi:hypothetical protein